MCNMPFQETIINRDRPPSPVPSLTMPPGASHENMSKGTSTRGTVLPAIALHDPYEAVLDYYDNNDVFCTNLELLPKSDNFFNLAISQLTMSCVSHNSLPKAHNTPWGLESNISSIFKHGNILTSYEGNTMGHNQSRTIVSVPAEVSLGSIVRRLNYITHSMKKDAATLDKDIACIKDTWAIFVILICNHSLFLKQDPNYALKEFACYGFNSLFAYLNNARKDIDANSKDQYGQSPLSYAAQNSYKAIVQLLLAQKDIDVSSQNEYRDGFLNWVSKMLMQSPVAPGRRYDQNVPVAECYRNILTIMSEESMIARQSKLAEGFFTSAISAHGCWKANRKYHKLRDPFPHTADPPIDRDIAVPTFEKQTTHNFSNYSLLFYLHSKQHSQTKHKDFVLQPFFSSTVFTVQTIVLEILAQTIFITIARTYITIATLRLYYSTPPIIPFKLRNIILCSPAGSNMENFDEAFWSQLSPVDSPSPQTPSTEQLTPQADSPETYFPDLIMPDSVCPTNDLFDEWVDPRAYNSPTTEDGPQVQYETYSFESSVPTHLEPSLYTPNPTGTEQIEIGIPESSSSGSSPVTTPEGSASPSPEAPLCCRHPNCNKGGFRRNCDLRKHEKTHDKSFFCKYTSEGCTRGFSSRKDKKRHEQTVHEKKRDFKCPYCTHSKSRRDNLKDHIRRVHRDRTE